MPHVEGGEERERERERERWIDTAAEERENGKDTGLLWNSLHTKGGE